MPNRNIWVFVEQRNNHILNVGLELLGKARELADQNNDRDHINNSRVAAILCGHDIEQKASSIFAAGADEIHLFKDETLANYHPGIYPGLVARLAQDYTPLVLLFGATTIGRDLAPAVAAQLNTGCSADCCDLDLDSQGNLIQTVPAFGGRIMAHIITPNHRPQLATVRPGVFKPPADQYKNTGDIKRPSFSIPEPAATKTIEILNVQWDTGGREDLVKAKTVVAGGAGIKDDQGWELIHQLAEKMGGAVAGSRPAVDAGRVSETQMIGQSGLTIRPHLYIAAGISGDIQHMIGVQESEIIVAINKDPKAPILKQADFGIVGDYREILPLLIDSLIPSSNIPSNIT